MSYQWMKMARSSTKRYPVLQRSFWTCLPLLLVMWPCVGTASIGNIVKSDLQGNWQISLRGITSCGFVDMQANVTLGSTGSGTGLLQTHGQCGNSTLTGQSFSVTSLAANGAGTAALSCGTACGWKFSIQVAADRSWFSLVDTTDTGQLLEGVGVLTSPNGNISTSDMRGSWQLTLYGVTGCGDSSLLVTFTLPTSGTTSNATETGASSNCGVSTTSGQTFQITSMNANGSGTAGLSCGSGCGWTFNIQMSPDRSTFNLVDMNDPNNFLEGVAVNNSTAAKISVANLSGSWELALDGFTFPENGLGDSTEMATFTLNASGQAINASGTFHTSTGNFTFTNQTFTIQSLNADGSGTAIMSVGGSGAATPVFTIQVSPDRSTMNLVAVSNGGVLWEGTATHR